MANFLPLGFLDTSNVAATLVLKYKDRFKDNTLRQEFEGSPHHDTETIFLRGPEKVDKAAWLEDSEQVDYPVYREWKSARNLAARIKNLVSSTSGRKNLQFGKVMIVSLNPGGIVDWHIDEGEYAEAHDRLHLCLLPSDGAICYSGRESAMLPVGQLFFFNNRVAHSAANFGDCARVHLIADVRRADAA